jgi:hypothetical protein
MTAKEKAEELFDKYYQIFEDDEDEHYIGTSKRISKQCAMIAVDEILKNQENVVWKINKILSAFSIDKKLELSEKYWQEVKQFIEEI